MRGFRSYRRLGIVVVFAIATLPCRAAEVAVLKNGFSIRCERRQVIGTVTRLFVKADGSSYVDILTTQIDHFEAAPEEPAARPASSSAYFQSSRSSAAAFPLPQANLDNVVNEASGRYHLDPDLVNSVIKAESGFNVRAVSPKGAQGLMQLMPGTASQLGVANAFDPSANVDGGTRYLRELLERYNFDLVKALAAYNAGPQRVAQFGGVPPYFETRAYVARIVRDFNKKKIAQEKAAAKAPKAKTANSAAPRNTQSRAAKTTSHAVTQANASPAN
jgi:soluble lytic murein transglycosylase-like protein